VGAPFESEEETRPRRGLRLLRVVQWLLFAAVLERWGWMLWGWAASRDGWGAWRGVGPEEFYQVKDVASLVVHLVVLGAAVRPLANLARDVIGSLRLPRGATVARVDEAGLHAGDRLLVARGAIARVEVHSDTDLGFALVVTTRDGATVRIPQRSEASARSLAAALEDSPDGQRLVFEGVSGVRRRETRAGAIAVLGFVVLAALPNLLNYALISPRAWGWFHFRGYEAEIRNSLAWWLNELCAAGLLPVAAAVALVVALGAVARRLRPGRVAVGRQDVQAGEQTIAGADIAAVEADTASDVTLALRDGKKVRLTFGADRSLVERDLFVARVRAMMNQAVVETYPAAETSGVRVAVSAEAGAPAEPDEEEDADAPARARRGAR
jgi:hypothetical protein